MNIRLRQEAGVQRDNIYCHPTYSPSTFLKNARRSQVAIMQITERLDSPISVQWAGTESSSNSRYQNEFFCYSYSVIDSELKTKLQALDIGVYLYPYAIKNI